MTDRTGRRRIWKKSCFPVMKWQETGDGLVFARRITISPDRSTIICPWREETIMGQRCSHPCICCWGARRMSIRDRRSEWETVRMRRWMITMMCPLIINITAHWQTDFHRRKRCVWFSWKAGTMRGHRFNGMIQKMPDLQQENPG